MVFTKAGKLMDAQRNAQNLFQVAENRGFFTAGQTEKDLNNRIYQLAEELFGIKKYWHKRIVRAGQNTLFPYDENPQNLVIQDDDIFFLDFGPVFEDWEADVGRTFVLGNNPLKIKIARDVETGFTIGKAFFKAHPEITGAEFYQYSVDLANRFGWEFGGGIAGHIIGNFPHKEIIGSEVIHYVHPDNHQKMNEPDQFGQIRHWIYEVHYVDREKEIGGFYEQLLTIDEEAGSSIKVEFK